MMKDDFTYLKHILDSAKFIDKYSKKIDLADFCKNELLQNAVIRQLEIMGEAAKLVSKKTQQNLKNIQWNKIISMRNKLIHEYFGVDLQIVWTTIKEEIPKLKKELIKYLA